MTEKKRKILERMQKLKEQYDAEADLIFLEGMQLELKALRQYNHLQKTVWRRKGWRDYTR